MGWNPQRHISTVFTGPFTLFLFVLLVVPFVNVAAYSLYTYSPSKIATATLTFDNYARLWDAFTLRLFVRTMKIGLITTGGCLVLGYPLAYFLARARKEIATLGLFLLITPLMVSTVIRVFGWIVILGRKGLVNQLLVFLGFESGIKLLYTETAVIIGMINIFLPFMTLPIMSSIERISLNLEEAARNLGANWHQVFTRTLLPLSMPGVISGCLLVYTVAISAYVTPALMGGPTNRLIGSEVYDEVLVSFNWPGASAITVVLIGVTALMIFAALRATRVRSRPGEAP